MTERITDYGRLIVGLRSELFACAIELAKTQHMRSPSRPFTWALSGGETPQAWYRWCAETQAIPRDLLASAHFTVSDERPVPFDSAQSNFGNAERLLLAPLNVPPEHRHPWPVDRAPEESADSYRQIMAKLSGPDRGYCVCLLGLGDDAHTASFFPESPLLRDDGGVLFTAVLTAAKGWRLTVTPTGLRACDSIIVMALGSHKATALRRVFTGAYDPLSTPAQILKTCAGQVVWLVDEAAAKEF